MNEQILNNDQGRLLPLILQFSSDFYLAGGTAISLHLGHRRSIDFDLFSNTTIDPIKIINIIKQQNSIQHTFSQGSDELTVLIDKVKVTFLHYPFTMVHETVFEQTLTLPDLITLGSMKAFALGKRAKWKDYVDLYFIFQKYSFQELMDKTSDIFKAEFNEKLFRSQLGYFDDIDYSEQIEYMTGFEKKDDDIKQFLEKMSLS